MDYDTKDFGDRGAPDEMPPKCSACGWIDRASGGCSYPKCSRFIQRITGAGPLDTVEILEREAYRREREANAVGLQSAHVLAGKALDAEEPDVLYEDDRGFVATSPALSREAGAPPPTERLPLPSDSAARKRVPIATGCFDYFHDALAAASFAAASRADPDHTLAVDMIEDRLRGQDDAGYVDWRGELAAIALDYLQWEITGVEPNADTCVLLERWPHALAAVAEGSWVGNEKHNPGEPLHHARGKSMDHADCIARHLLERGGWDVVCLKDGRSYSVRHSTWLAWRALALCQEHCEAEGAPLARGARLPK